MNKMNNHLVLLFSILLLVNSTIISQSKGDSEKLWSVRIADSFIERTPEYILYDPAATSQRWHYEQGLMLETMKQMYLYTGDDKYYNYIKQNIDGVIEENGNIKTYRVDEYNIDQITPGRAVMYLYQVTGEEKYKIAIDTLRKQLSKHPRTETRGFWHKKIYPYQMWLDGLYMGQPFYTEYSKLFNETENFDDIAHQFILCYEKTKDSKTGLLYHAWDESKKQKWADPETGLSPNFWGRSIGWYMMALVDVLDFFPSDHPKREILITQLRELSSNILKFRHPQKNVWYQVVDLADREGNYPEASATAMYTFALAKGVNKGYLDPIFLEHAKASFQGMLNEFVTIDENGLVNLHNVCSVAGLGGKQERDGSFEYYISEKIRTNDFKGYGPFLLAAIELERSNNMIGEGIKVSLDNYYNNEFRKNKQGEIERYHYILDDTTNSGFSEFGKIFERYGAEISEMKIAPTFDNLKEYSIYIIVDPDTPKETENPNYIVEKDITEIVKWVNNGGLLLLMANDAGNCEFEHLNNLVKEFGWHFNEVSFNKVDGRQYDMGAFVNLPYHPIFNSLSKIYMKEISTITVDSPQYVILKKDNDAAIAFKRFGKGGLIAVGDPWLYNEYIDNRRLPVDFENYKAAENFVEWMLSIVSVIRH